MNINSRIFGSDIPVKVKKKLEARQRASWTKRDADEQILDSLYLDDRSEYYTYGELLNNPFHGEIELSSRTPFTRMWTAVELTEQVDFYDQKHIDRGDSQKWYKNLNMGTQAGAGHPILLRQKKFPPDVLWEEVQQYVDNLYEIDKGTTFAKQYPKIIVRTHKNTGHIYVFRQEGEYKNLPGFRSVYVVNDQLTGTLETNPNESVQHRLDALRTSAYYEDELAESGFWELKEAQQNAVASKINSIFPYEHYVDGDNNKFLRPAAGITSVHSETEGSLGVIKKTTVNFTVHNFADFDKIYNKYFLRPGAQIFVDFGWSNISEDLYDPTALIHQNDIQYKLFDGSDSFIGRNQGDVDTVVGLVTDYDSQIKENGSVECSLTITSKNTALLDQNTERQRVATRVNYLIDHLITFDALYKNSTPVEREILFGGMPGKNSSTQDVAVYQELISEYIQSSLLTRTDGIPMAESVASGLYVNKATDDSHKNYISWGLFEDKILNSEFGFGSDIDDVNKFNKDNFQVTIDSSIAFTTYSPDLYERQRAIMRPIHNGAEVNSKQKAFLYPARWGIVPSIDQKNQAPGSTMEGLFQDEYDATLIEADYFEDEIGENAVFGHYPIASGPDNFEGSGNYYYEPKGGGQKVAIGGQDKYIMMPDTPFYDIIYQWKFNHTVEMYRKALKMNNLMGAYVGQYQYAYPTPTIGSSPFEYSDISDQFGTTAEGLEDTVYAYNPKIGMHWHELIYLVEGITPPGDSFSNSVYNGTAQSVYENFGTAEFINANIPKIGNYSINSQISPSNTSWFEYPEGWVEEDGLEDVDIHTYEVSQDQILLGIHKVVQYWIQIQRIAVIKSYNDTVHGDTSAVWKYENGDTSPEDETYKSRREEEKNHTGKYMTEAKISIVNTFPIEAKTYIKENLPNASDLKWVKSYSIGVDKYPFSEYPRFNTLASTATTEDITKSREDLTRTPLSVQYWSDNAHSYSYGFQGDVYVMSNEQIQESRSDYEKTIESQGYPEMTMYEYFDWDYEHKQIPIREMFIDTEVIKDAFKSSKTTHEVLERILKKINADSGGIFDWQVATKQGDDTSIQIVDYNFMGLDRTTNSEGLTQNEEDTFNNLFVFDVMGKTSFVKGYNVNLSLPQGNIGNMYAIQGMRANDSMYPINSLEEENLSLNSLLGHVANPDGGGSEKFISYLPNNSMFRAERLNRDENQNANLKATYGDYVGDMLNSKPDPKHINHGSLWTPTIQQSHYDDQVSLEYEDGGSGPNTLTQNIAEKIQKLEEARNLDEEERLAQEELVEQQERINEAVMDAEESKMNSLGYRVEANMNSYYETVAAGKFYSDQRSSPFPLTLSLTIYGMSSIQPGDIFRVNYLPEVYRDNVYFQVMKVKHDLGLDGWYTTLETQFRVRPTKKDMAGLIDTRSSIRLSPRSLASLNIGKYTYPKTGPGSHNQFKSLFASYITNIQPLGIPSHDPLVSVRSGHSGNGRYNDDHAGLLIFDSEKQTYSLADYGMEKRGGFMVGGMDLRKSGPGAGISKFNIMGVTDVDFAIKFNVTDHGHGKVVYFPFEQESMLFTSAGIGQFFPNGWDEEWIGGDEPEDVEKRYSVGWRVYSQTGYGSIYSWINTLFWANNPGNAPLHVGHSSTGGSRTENQLSNNTNPAVMYQDAWDQHWPTSYVDYRTGWTGTSMYWAPTMLTAESILQEWESRGTPIHSSEWAKPDGHTAEPSGGGFIAFPKDGHLLCSSIKSHKRPARFSSPTTIHGFWHDETNPFGPALSNGGRIPDEWCVKDWTEYGKNKPGIHVGKFTGFPRKKQMGIGHHGKDYPVPSLRMQCGENDLARIGIKLHKDNEYYMFFNELDGYKNWVIMEANSVLPLDLGGIHGRGQGTDWSSGRTITARTFNTFLKSESEEKYGQHVWQGEYTSDEDTETQYISKPENGSNDMGNPYYYNNIFSGLGHYGGHSAFKGAFIVSPINKYRGEPAPPNVSDDNYYIKQLKSFRNQCGLGEFKKMWEDSDFWRIGTPDNP